MIWDNPLKNLVILRPADITENMHTNVWAQPVLSQWNDTSVPKHYGITISLNTKAWAQPMVRQCNDTSVLGIRWHYQKSE